MQQVRGQPGSSLPSLQPPTRWACCFLHPHFPPDTLCTYLSCLSAPCQKALEHRKLSFFFKIFLLLLWTFFFQVFHEFVTLLLLFLGCEACAIPVP